MNELRNFLLYCGLPKEDYFDVISEVRKDMRKTILRFTLPSFAIFALLALFGFFTGKTGMGCGIYALMAALSLLFAVLTATLSRRIPKIRDFIGCAYINCLLLIGVYAGVSQPD